MCSSQSVVPVFKKEVSARAKYGENNHLFIAVNDSRMDSNIYIYRYISHMYHISGIMGPNSHQVVQTKMAKTNN